MSICFTALAKMMKKRNFILMYKHLQMGCELKEINDDIMKRG
jgi:hypothetical protein